MNRSVVITGLGVVSSIGNSIETYWNNLLQGHSGVSFIKSFDVKNYPTQIGAEIEEDLLNTNFSHRERARCSRVSLMALLASKQALAQAGLTGSKFLDQLAVFIGCSQGGFAESEVFFKTAIVEGKTSVFGLLRPMNSAPTTNVTINHQIRGLSLSVDAACSSAGHTIGIATKLIQCGFIDVALVGGADTPFSPVIFRSWCNLRVLSTRNADPTAACKPFSRNRDGTVLGEGAGILILEAEEFAAKRGALPLARIVGYGASSDAYNLTMPSAEGMSLAIRSAMRDSNLLPGDLDCINAHGTGTESNDSKESEAIKMALGEHAHRIPISGNKACVGHTLAASGAMEAIACVCSLQSGVIPPSINYEERDLECNLNIVANHAREVELRHVMSTSFAFGGSNAAVIFGKV